MKTITLNKVFEEHKINVCDFLKLDIEGAEWRVLHNLSVQNLHKIKQIAMEYHNNKNKEINRLEERLKRNDFEVFVIPSKYDVSTGYLYAKKS